MTNNLLRDSLIGKKIIDGIWEIPWAIVVDIRRIQGMVREHTEEVLHAQVHREGNMLADFLTEPYLHCRY